MGTKSWLACIYFSFGKEWEDLPAALLEVHFAVEGCWHKSVLCCWTFPSSSHSGHLLTVMLVVSYSQHIKTHNNIFTDMQIICEKCLCGNLVIEVHENWNFLHVLCKKSIISEYIYPIACLFTQLFSKKFSTVVGLFQIWSGKFIFGYITALYPCLIGFFIKT